MYLTSSKKYSLNWIKKLQDHFYCFSPQVQLSYLIELEISQQAMLCNVWLMYIPAIFVLHDLRGFSKYRVVLDVGCYNLLIFDSEHASRFTLPMFSKGFLKSTNGFSTKGLWNQGLFKNTKSRQSVRIQFVLPDHCQYVICHLACQLSQGFRGVTHSSHCLQVLGYPHCLSKRTESNKATLHPIKRTIETTILTFPGDSKSNLEGFQFIWVP